MENLVEFVTRQPLLLLFLIMAVGAPLGHVRVRGVSLGPAAVLFVGLLAGAIHPSFRVPKEIQELGLALFVYTMGLAAGPGFFASFRAQGLRYNLLVALVLVGACGLTLALQSAWNFRPTIAAGLFTGALTSTPALAAVVEQLDKFASPARDLPWVKDPVVAYSMAYPGGVLGMVCVILVLRRFRKVDLAAEKAASAGRSEGSPRLENRTLRITRADACGIPLAKLEAERKWDVVFGRFERGGKLSLAAADTAFEIGDFVSVIGSAESVATVVGALGEAVDRQLELDRGQLDFRRIFVSDPQVAGHRLRDLNLPQQFGAIVTRIRRGDLEFVPHGDTVLELGDRVRVVTRRDHLPAVSKFFGDSYRTLSEINILSFSLGLAFGLMLGTVPIPVPFLGALKLGFAGGPLVAALLLGSLERTGPLVWSLPYSANLTIRQIGLTFFLAGVGCNAGGSFFRTMFESPDGIAMLAAGLIVTCTTAFAFLLLGHLLLKIPTGRLLGMLAGLQTQPALLSFACEQTQDESPNLGYAVVFPAAMVIKILLAQAILMYGLTGQVP